MLTFIRLLVAGALTTYAGALVFVLLTPSGSVPSDLVADAMALGVRLDAPAKVIERNRVEFSLNVLAFVPLAFLGSLLFRSVTVSTWIASAFATSLLVEAIQTTMPERMAAHSDVVANTAGAAVGALAAWILLRGFRRTGQLEGSADLPDGNAPTQHDQLTR